MTPLRYPPAPDWPAELDAHEASFEEIEAPPVSPPSTWSLIGPALVVVFGAGMLVGVLLWRLL